MRSIVSVGVCCGLLPSVKISGHEGAEDHPVESAEIGITRERAGAAGTADQFVIGEAESSSEEDAEDDF